MKLAQVVPWGRSYDEYRRMFGLTDADLAGRILGCADGPAAFNADATQAGATVVSCDPLYQFPPEAIQARIDATADTVIDQTRRHQGDFVWRDIADVDALRSLRLRAMSRFISDFAHARRAAGAPRYIAASLPDLPFAKGTFTLALCSHLLFLYSDHLDEAFHVAALTEMCRVANEVRVFPLVDLACQPSRHLEPVMQCLTNAGYDLTVTAVDYTFQRGANKMLRVTAPSRKVQP